MSTYDEQRDRIEAIYAKWRPLLGLDAWDVTRQYHDGAYVMGDGRPSKPDASASAHVYWEYQTATLDFNTEACEDNDDRYMETVVVHECMHILLRELRGKEGDGPEDWLEHEEHACTMLAWAFMRTQPT